MPDKPVLVKDDDGLSLVRGDLRLRGDLTGMRPRIRKANLRGELLVKASGIREGSGPARAVDATAGLGEDAFLLAAAGFDVTLFERDPLIAELLEDAIKRAVLDPDLAEAARRMHLRQGDSIEGLAELDARPDLIYLDPMFPAKKKSSLTGKKLQLFRMLENPCPDEEALFQAALGACPMRIIVKRPLKGPHLAGRKPTFALSGKSVRFDVYQLTVPDTEVVHVP